MKTPLTRRGPGFSLVEVLAAVAIVGILIFIAIPNVIRARQDSEEQLVIARAQNLNMAMSQYIQANGRALAATNWGNASTTHSVRYDKIKGYLAYAPEVLADYQPSGYSFEFPNTPDLMVTVKKGTGASAVIIPY